jgi:hypothetical protein
MLCAACKLQGETTCARLIQWPVFDTDLAQVLRRGVALHSTHTLSTLGLHPQSYVRGLEATIKNVLIHTLAHASLTGSVSRDARVSCNGRSVSIHWLKVGETVASARIASDVAARSRPEDVVVDNKVVQVGRSKNCGGDTCTR